MHSCNGRGRGSDNAIMMSVNMEENAGGSTYDMRCGNNNYYVLRGVRVQRQLKTEAEVQGF